ncbi:hypothetical protein AAG906_035589 [Vitis piasezkii]
MVGASSSWSRALVRDLTLHFLRHRYRHRHRRFHLGCRLVLSFPSSCKIHQNKTTNKIFAFMSNQWRYVPSGVKEFDLGNDFWSFFHCCRASSCKVYGVVPPPHQLLVGVQSSGNELNVKTSSNPCLTSSDGSSTPTPLVSSFDFVNSDLSFWCFSCDAYLDAQAIL